MTHYTFELGFDWNMPSSESAIGLIYVLQMVLVDGEKVVSPCHTSCIRTGDSLTFRIFDITDRSRSTPETPAPQALQILFSGADAGSGDFSPILDRHGNQRSHLAATTFLGGESAGDVTSTAYGDVARAWSAAHLRNLELGVAGRFELRALLTLAEPGKMARFYRVDPEMVIGDG